MKNLLRASLLILAITVSSFGTTVNAQVIEGEEHEKACVLVATDPQTGTIQCKGKGKVCSGWKDCAENNGNPQLQ